MSQAQKIPFLNLFSAWRPGEELAALAGGYLVTGAVIDKAARSIRAKVECPRMPEEGLRHQIEKSLALAYRVERVELEMGAAAATAPASAPVAAEPAPAASAPPPPPPAAPAEEDAMAAFRRTEEIRRRALAGLKTASPREKKAASGGPRGKLLYGKHEIKRESIPMSTLELDMGTVIVKGDVFAVDHRELKKRGAWVVCFDVTDYTGSVRVSKFFPGDEGKGIVDGVKKGQHLVIQGKLNIDRFTGDMVLEPYAIMESAKPMKTDDAGGSVGPSGHRHHRPRRGPGIPRRLALGQEDQGALRRGGVFHQRRRRPGGGTRGQGTRLYRRYRLFRH